jgi:hypothetical protein
MSAATLRAETDARRQHHEALEAVQRHLDYKDPLYAAVGACISIACRQWLDTSDMHRAAVKAERAWRAAADAHRRAWIEGGMKT